MCMPIYIDCGVEGAYVMGGRFLHRECEKFLCAQMNLSLTHTYEAHMNLSLAHTYEPCRIHAYPQAASIDIAHAALIYVHIEAF